MFGFGFAELYAMKCTDVATLNQQLAKERALTKQAEQRCMYYRDLYIKEVNKKKLKPRFKFNSKKEGVNRYELQLNET